MNLLYIFSRELDYALGWTIIHSFWQATLCALLLSLIVVLYPKRHTRVRYLFANATLFLVLCCSVATFIYESHKAKQRFNVVYIPTIKNQEKEKSSTGDPMSGGLAVETGVFSSLRQTTASFNEYFNRHFPLFVLIWAFGVCLFVMRLLGGVTYIFYLKQRMNFSPAAHWLKITERLARSAGFQRTIVLVESVLARGPIVVGFFKPMILLPFGLLNKLTQEEAEAVLAHEIAHIIRQDYLFNIIQSVIEALFYYNPAVWLISSIIRNERESACDEMAIRMTGNAVNYARALVAVQEIAYYPASTALAFAGSGKSQFMHRIERVLNVQQHKRNHLEKIVTVLCTFILLGILAVGRKIENSNIPLITPGIRLQENSNASGLSGIGGATIQGNGVFVTFSNGLNGSRGNQFSDLAVHEVNANVKGQGIGNADVAALQKAKMHGVEPDYIERLKRIGYDKLTIDEIIELKNYGVDTGYIIKLNKISNETLTALRIVDAVKHGIDPATAAKVTPGKGGVSSYNEIKKLTIHGVDAAYVESMNKAGLGILTNDQLITAKTNAINAGYVKSMKALNLDELDFDHIVTCKIQEIDAGYIRGLQESGLNLGIDKIILFKMHDITPSYVRSFKPVYRRNLSEKEALEFHIQNVKADFVEGFRKYSLGDIPPEKAMQLKILDITPQYVEYLKNKGIDLAGIDGVIACKKRCV